MLLHCHLIDIFSGKKILISFLSWFPIYIFFPFPLAAFKVFSLPLVLNNVIWFALIQCFLCLEFMDLPGSMHLSFLSQLENFAHYSLKYIFLSLISLFRDANTICIKQHKNFPQLTVLPFFFFSFCDPFLVVSIVYIQVY